MNQPTATTSSCPCGQPGHGGSCSRIPSIVEAIDLEAEQLTPGKHELAIRERFGMSLARYQQILNGYFETAEAVEHNPLLVHGARARRDLQEKARADRTFLTKYRKDPS